MTLRRVLYPLVKIVPQFSACLTQGRLRRPAAVAVFTEIRKGVAARQSDLIPA